MGVSVNLTHPSAHNTADTQTAYAPPAPHWRAYRQALHLHRYKIPPPRRTLYRAGQPPIIICIGMGAPVRIVMDPCQAAHLLRGQRLHLYRVSPAAVWHRVSGQGASGRLGTLYPAEQSSSRGAAGGAEPLTATAVSLFGLSPDS